LGGVGGRKLRVLEVWVQEENRKSWLWIKGGVGGRKKAQIFGSFGCRGKITNLCSSGLKRELEEARKLTVLSFGSRRKITEVVEGSKE